MPWFRVDDQLAFHRKALFAGNAAMGLWVRAGSWSAQFLTDGSIPSAIVRSLGSKKQAEKLVEAGLWCKEPDGYSFHQWAAWQPRRPDPDKQRKYLSPDMRRMVVSRDGLTCGLCGDEVPEQDVHIDHIRPVSGGGTNELSNLQVTHSRCNIAKGAHL